MSAPSPTALFAAPPALPPRRRDEGLLRPSPAAMAEVWRAADRFDELAEAGYHVAFSPGSRGLRIELEDANGHTFRRLAPSEALDLAAGAPVA